MKRTSKNAKTTKKESMTNIEILEKADEILLEALEPYEMFPKWAQIVLHLSKHHDSMAGLKKSYHEESSNQQQDSGAEKQEQRSGGVADKPKSEGREARFRALLEDTIRAHSTPDNGDYNECDTDPCAWCD